MKTNKTKIFTIRLSPEYEKAIRHLSNCNCVSCGSVIRRILRSYFVLKGLLK